MLNRKIKAEMWDKMQFLFRNYYDRMVHAVLHYDSLIDVNIMKNLIIMIAEKVPILRSKFVHNPISPYWLTQDYQLSDLLLVKDSIDLEKDIDEFSTYSIPYDNNTQFKIAIFNHDNKSTLCMLVNHMCFDGGDLKYFLSTLAKDYTNALENNIFKCNIKTGSRSHEMVYTKFNENLEKEAKKLYKNISAVKDDHRFPLTPPTDDDKCFIAKRIIPKEIFDKLLATGKRLSATMNDLLLAVYMHAIYDIADFPTTDSITVPCMVDLRRYIERIKDTGLTNHTGFMQCTIPKKGEDIFETLALVAKINRKNKRDPFLGLYSLPLLKLAYGIFPHSISEFAIKLGYINPLMGMSNIGKINSEDIKFGNSNILSGYITGAIKYKPYMQLSVSSIAGELTLTIAVKGNDDDKKILESFFDLIEINIDQIMSKTI